MLNVLRQHQSEFAGALLNNQSDYELFIRKITKTSKISPQLALNIYKNNTRGVRLKSLEIIYPICRKILGDKIFYLIGQQYINEDADGTSDLNHYGESLNLHLKSLLEAGRLPEEYCYLIDLAALEYKIHAAYYEKADSMFPFSQFKRKINNKQKVYFKLSSTLGLISSKYPIYEIWRSNKEQQYAEEIETIESKQYLLVYRNEYKSSAAVISNDEYNIVKAIIDNFSLQEIISNADCNVNDILPVLIANKWIVGIK